MDSKRNAKLNQLLGEPGAAEELRKAVNEIERKLGELGMSHKALTRRDVIETAPNLADLAERVAALESVIEQIAALLNSQGGNITPLTSQTDSGTDTIAPSNRTLPKKSLDENARRALAGGKINVRKDGTIEVFDGFWHGWRRS